jgi:hypothetical protein
VTPVSMVDGAGPRYAPDNDHPPAGQHQLAGHTLVSTSGRKP